MGLLLKFDRRAAPIQESKSFTGRGGLSKWLFSFALYHIGRASLQPQCSADGSNGPGGMGRNIFVSNNIRLDSTFCPVRLDYLSHQPSIGVVGTLDRCDKERN